MLSLSFTIIKSNFVSLKRPYKLNFAITYLCNSRCLTCNIWKIKPKNELTLGEIKKFAEKNNYFKWIELTGGEPFLRSDIVEIVKTFKENSKDLFLLTIPTNSLVEHNLVENKIKQILDLKIPRVAITISLDGYKELEDKIRGVAGNYEKAIDLYKRLKQLQNSYKNLYVVFGYTLSELNKGEFMKTFEAVKQDIPEITYNNFHINLAQISDNYYQNSNLQISTYGKDVAEEIKSILEKRRKTLSPFDIIETRFLKGLVYFAETGKMPMPSRSLEASIFLDSYGNVFPSIMWSKKIGNIRETNYDLSTILKCNEAEEVHKAVKEEKEPLQWTACEAYQSILGCLLHNIV